MADITGTSANDVLTGGDFDDLIIGGGGADTLTGGGGTDRFRFVPGDSTLTVGGPRNAGTIAGFDVITDFAAGETLELTGVTIVDDGVGNRLARTTLRLAAGGEVRSHSVADGVISFGTSGRFSVAAPLTSLSDVAVAVQYLQAINFGSTGATVAFSATIGGVDHTFVFVQGAINAQDVLVDLVGVTAGSVSAAGGQIAVNVIDVAPPPPAGIDPGPTAIGAWGNDNTFEFSNTVGTPELIDGEAPALAGVQSGFPALAWHTVDGIQVQFIDLLGNNDPDPLFGRLTVSDGEGAERGVQIVDALSGYGVAWQEGADGAGTVKLRFVVAEQAPVGVEMIVGGENPAVFDPSSFDNHSFSIGAYDFAINVDVADPADPTTTVPATANGVNVAWVASALGDTGAYGQIMVQRYQILLDATGHVSGLAAAGLDGQSEANANRTAADADALGLGLTDDVVVVAASGRDPSITGLHTGETLIAWIEQLGGVERVNAVLYPPNGAFVPSDTTNNGLTATDYANVNAALAAMVSTVATDQGVKVQEFGPGNFVVTWLAPGDAGGLTLNGKMFILPPDNALGDALPAGWTEYDITPVTMPAGFAGDYQLTGLGENDGDVVVAYSADDADGSGVFAFVIEGDGADPGIPPGTVTAHEQVNTQTTGDQGLVAITGLISERFLVSYVESDGTIVSRIMDTREPGQFLRGDRVDDRNASGVIDTGDRVRSLPDIIVGTVADDVIIGELVDPQIGGADFSGGGDDDQLFGGLGADILFGGAGFDILDGGNDLVTPGGVDDPTLGAAPVAYQDRAIFLGEQVHYNVWINGDGSYSVLDARFDSGQAIDDELADGTLNIDGWNIAANLELLQFLEGDVDYIRNAESAVDLDAALAALAIDPNANHTFVDTSELYRLRGQDELLTGNVDEVGDADVNPLGIELVATPAGWGNTRAEADYGIKVADGVDALGAEVAEMRPVIGATADGFVLGWSVPGTTNATFQFANYDALAKPVAVDAGIDPAGGAVVTVSANAVLGGPMAVSGLGANTIAVWLENVGTGFELRGQMFDLGGNGTGGPLTISSALAAGEISELSISEQAIDFVPQADPGQPDGLIELDTEFTATWVLNADVDGFGQLWAQRYAVMLDTTTGLDQQPVAVGRSGDPRDGINDTFMIDAIGRSPTSAGLHDGEVAFAWVTPAEDGGVQGLVGMVIAPTNDGTASLFDFDFADVAGFAGVAPGTAATVYGAGEGDISVSFVSQKNGAYVAELAVFAHAGAGAWTAPGTVIDLVDFGATPPSDLSISVVGEDAPEYIVSWRGADGEIVAQRFDTAGIAVGDVLEVTAGRDETSGDGGAQTTADDAAALGLLDGRFVIAYTETDTGGDLDIEARVFDTRSSGVAVIGRDAGGPRDFLVGTPWDDVMDGRDRADELHGALGNDILIGGINDDVVDGGAGDDDLFGGTGTDTLTGGDGNDLLVGGYGRDYISGGTGIDTLSYQGEARAVEIDLEIGLVRSDPAVNAVVLPDPAITLLDFPDAARIDTAIEDVLGEVVEVNHDLEIFQFVYDQDIENAIGSAGDDIIRGHAGANVFTGDRGDDLIEGRGGDDTIDGGLGRDTARFSGARAEYMVSELDGVITVAHTGSDGVDTLTSVEQLDFNGTVLSIEEALGSNPATFLQFAASETLVDTQELAIGALIGTVSAITGTGLSVPGFTFAFAVGGNPGGLFAVDPASGAVTVATTITLDFETQPAFALGFTASNAAETIATTASVMVADVNEAFGDVIIPDGGVVQVMLDNDPDAMAVADIRVVGDPDGFTTGLRTYQFEITGDTVDGTAGTAELNRFVVPLPAEDMPADAIDPAGSQYVLELNLDDPSVQPLDFDEEVLAGRFGDVTTDASGTRTATNTLTLRTWEDLGGNGVFDAGVDMEDVLEIVAVLRDVNEAPVTALAPETNAGAAGAIIEGNLLAGSDADGDALTFALVANTDGLAVLIDPATGTYSVTAAPGFVGDATFDYVVSDGFLESAPKTVTISVSAPPPVLGETFIGSNNAAVVDTFAGTIGNDTIEGNRGNDILNGGDGDDAFVYVFGDGADTVDGGTGFDTLRIVGNAGNNRIDVGFDGTAITDFEVGTLANIESITMNLGGETTTGDTLSYAGSTAAVVVDLGAGTASGFTSIAGVERVIGGISADTLAGDGGTNLLSGGLGDDILNGGGGNDTLTGGGGFDTFVFDAAFGVDSINGFDANPGGGGQDLIDLRSFGIAAGEFGSRVGIGLDGGTVAITIDDDPDQVIHLSNVTNLAVITIDDFWL